MYLLDTNACIDLLNRSATPLSARMRAFAPSDIYLCSIVKAELIFGARKSARVNENLILLDRLFGLFRSLPFDDRAAQQYGAIRYDLGQRGAPIGANDVLIASIALANEATLVTANVGEFSRVIGLRTENWQA